MTLTAIQADMNTLYVACAVRHEPETYARNGAVRLNHQLQERARLNRAQAFQVVADAIASGVVRFVEQTKGVELVPEAFAPFRDRMIDFIGDVESEIVTLSWTRLTPPAVVDHLVRESLAKHVERGRLVELGGTRAGRAFTRIDKLLQGAVASGLAEYVSDAELVEIEQAAAALTETVDDLMAEDFVVVIARSRENGVVRAVKFSLDDPQDSLAQSPQSR